MKYTLYMIMKKSTIVVWMAMTGYVLAGCVVGYYTHKEAQLRKLEKEIAEDAKSILDTPDLTKKINLNIQTKHETNSTIPLLHSNGCWSGGLYNYRPKNH